MEIYIPMGSSNLSLTKYVSNMWKVLSFNCLQEGDFANFFSSRLSIVHFFYGKINSCNCNSQNLSSLYHIDKKIYGIFSVENQLSYVKLRHRFFFVRKLRPFSVFHNSKRRLVTAKCFFLSLKLSNFFSANQTSHYGKAH